MSSTIKTKIGKCIDCGPDVKEKPLTAKRCFHHYWIHRDEVNSAKKTKVFEPRKPIAKVSAKQLERLAKYRKIRNEFMTNKNCEAKLQGCTIKATDLHHAKGKIGDLLTDKRFFKALCRNCHNYIETHPNFAKENNYSLNRI